MQHSVLNAFRKMSISEKLSMPKRVNNRKATYVNKFNGREGYVYQRLKDWKAADAKQVNDRKAVDAMNE